ncbi:hypothetical protein SCUCBS95973_005996 [Sporothrix curviconia]|uniref:Uncharacterized protein n=1 Tax=Sporothrix curviconia TaxID=1260050 RepID=A0ABP0C1E3_9PEZI
MASHDIPTTVEVQARLEFYCSRISLYSPHVHMMHFAAWRVREAIDGFKTIYESNCAQAVGQVKNSYNKRTPGEYMAAVIYGADQGRADMRLAAALIAKNEPMWPPYSDEQVWHPLVLDLSTATCPVGWEVPGHGSKTETGSSRDHKDVHDGIPADIYGRGTPTGGYEVGEATAPAATQDRGTNTVDHDSVGVQTLVPILTPDALRNWLNQHCVGNTGMLETQDPFIRHELFKSACDDLDTALQEMQQWCYDWWRDLLRLYQDAPVGTMIEPPFAFNPPVPRPVLLRGFEVREDSVRARICEGPPPPAPPIPPLPAKKARVKGKTRRTAAKPGNPTTPSAKRLKRVKVEDKACADTVGETDTVPPAVVGGPLPASAHAVPDPVPDSGDAPPVGPMIIDLTKEDDNRSKVIKLEEEEGVGGVPWVSGLATGHGDLLMELSSVMKKVKELEQKIGNQ